MESIVVGDNIVLFLWKQLTDSTNFWFINYNAKSCRTKLY